MKDESAGRWPEGPWDVESGFLISLFQLCLPIMSIQNFGKGALRMAINYAKGYSDAQIKVRSATSNDPWGPSGTEMNEIAQMTYDQSVLTFVPLCFGSH